MKKNLETRADIELLVNSFYDKIRQDASIGYIFDEVAKVNWEKHLPKMYSFWEMILFNKEGYDGHPFRPHLIINQQHPLNSHHFATWLALFDNTVDEHFEGEKANEIKTRAKNVALSWAFKIHHLNKAEL